MLQKLYHKLDKIAKRLHHEIANSVRVCSNTKANIRSKTMQKIITTNLNLEEEIRLIKAYEAKEKELKELREEKEAELKKLLDNAGLEELQIGAFTIRFTKCVNDSDY